MTLPTHKGPFQDYAEYEAYHVKYKKAVKKVWSKKKTSFEKARLRELVYLRNKIIDLKNQLTVCASDRVEKISKELARHRNRLKELDSQQKLVK